jgi:uncharacterized surface protein with fasciclin (FAS1) repeats
MRKIATILLGLAFISIISCDESKTTTEQSESETSVLGREVTEAERRGMRLLKSRQDSKKRTESDTSKNKTSAYRYLTSSDEYPIFTNLMKKSNLSKYIHSADVTVLAPVDIAFEAYPNYKDLMLPGNEEQLDEFISYHLINYPMEYKEFTNETSWEVHAGPVLELSKEGGIYFNEAHVRSGAIETDKGSIIGLDDLVFFPQLPK